MTWTKLGDEFADEARDLTGDEFRTHVEALLWSNRRGLDLLVPKRDLRRFAESPGAADAAVGLVVSGWWEDHGDAWYIGVRFPEWQLKRSVIEKRRDDAAVRQRKHRSHLAGDHSLCLPGDRCKRDAHDAARAQERAQSQAAVTRDMTRDSNLASATSADLAVTHDETQAVTRDMTRDVTRLSGSGREGLSDLPVPPKTITPRKHGEYDDPFFGEFWDAYPRKTDKRRAWSAWQAALKRGAEPSAIVKAALGYAGHRVGADPQYTKHPATWLNAASYDDERAPVRTAERDDDSWMR